MKKVLILLPALLFLTLACYLVLVLRQPPRQTLQSSALTQESMGEEKNQHPEIIFAQTNNTTENLQLTLKNIGVDFILNSQMASSSQIWDNFLFVNSELPIANFEKELQKACQKAIIVYADQKDKTGKIEALLQKYPVILYLNATNLKTTVWGNLIAQAANPAESDRFNLFALSQGGVNILSTYETPIYLVPVYPHRYYEELPYTKTRSAKIKIKAFVKGVNETIKTVSYKLNHDQEVGMNYLGDSFYEAELDASELSGTHNLEFMATGNWSTAKQALKIYFSPEVPARPAPGCLSPSPGEANLVK